MACANVDLDIHGGEEENGASLKESPRMQYYGASEVVPDEKEFLRDLLKQPAFLGSLQMMSGLLSVGVGIIFAVTQEMTQSLITMFRVSHLTGTLFICAGFLSNILFKYPGLLPVSLVVNYGCIIIALAGACLISVDLANWNQGNQQFWRMELLELCVLGFEFILSGILCSWISQLKCSKFPWSSC